MTNVATKIGVRGRRAREVLAAPSWFDATAELEVPGISGLEARILDAARRCYLHYGPAKTSLNDVARLASVSRGSIYRYFTDRDVLLARVGEYGIAVFAIEMGRAMATGAKLEDQLSAAAAVTMRWAPVRQPQGFQPTAFEDSFESSRAHVTLKAISDTIKPFLAVARSRGEVRSGVDLDQATEFVARSLLSLAFSRGLTFDSDDWSSVDAFVRAFVVAGLD